MYNEPIFLKPVFQERIWGGQKLKNDFNYDIPFNRTGEAWVISADSNGPTIIQNGPLKGNTLVYAWRNHGNLFNKNDNNMEYPLLVKILDASNDLSVQVHPNDDFAFEIEGMPYGKTECWYVLSAEPESKLVIGHYASSRKEFERMINENSWERLLRYVHVKSGDFFYIPSGTLHAIGKGIVILEIQQSSDITYRVYDYNRVDSIGYQRVLHKEIATKVTTVPHKPVMVQQKLDIVGGLISKRLLAEQYFKVYHWRLDGIVEQKKPDKFLQVNVIQGGAVIIIGDKTFIVKKGTNFILPYSMENYQIKGKAEFIVSCIS